VLVIGSGPAGLEAAWALSRRGYDVAIAEARTEVGGRVTLESRLPGLSAWRRVRDYREYQLRQRPNVEIYLDSALSASEIMEFGFQNIAIATGATWRRDGVARQHVVPMPFAEDARIFTPDDLMAGRLPTGEVVIYDDDHYYMGGVLAELLVTRGTKVTLITPSAFVSDWTSNTLEQARIHARLDELGVEIVLNRGITQIAADHVTSNCVYTGKTRRYPAEAVVLVASRSGNDGLYHALNARQADWADAGIRSVKYFGDAEAAGPIAWATYAGHRYARELDAPDQGDALSFRREITELAVE
jgi:dimethylamine/trimethylamine dehydrogenase